MDSTFFRQYSDIVKNNEQSVTEGGMDPRAPFKAMPGAQMNDQEYGRRLQWYRDNNPDALLKGQPNDLVGWTPAKNQKYTPMVSDPEGVPATPPLSRMPTAQQPALRAPAQRNATPQAIDDPVRGIAPNPNRTLTPLPNAPLPPRRVQGLDLTQGDQPTQEDLSDVGDVVGQAARSVYDAPGKFIGGLKRGWNGTDNTANQTAPQQSQPKPPPGPAVAPPSPPMYNPRITGPSNSTPQPMPDTKPAMSNDPGEYMKPAQPTTNPDAGMGKVDMMNKYGSIANFPPDGTQAEPGNKSDMMNKFDSMGRPAPNRMQEGQLMRSFANMLREAEVISELGTGTGAVATPAKGMPGSGPQTSTVGVHPGDKNRVTVAPNVQKSVLDYERQKAQTDAFNADMVDQRSPKANSWGRDISQAIGNNVVGPVKAFVHGLGQGYDDSDAGPVRNDPARPVDVIPNPRQGTTTPRESANDHLRKLSDIVAEAEQFKGITNQGNKAKDMMKPYKG